jgi:hypothetical protein
MSLNLIAAEKGTDLVLSTALIILKDVELPYALAIAINYQRVLLRRRYQTLMTLVILYSAFR